MQEAPRVPSPQGEEGGKVPMQEACFRKSQGRVGVGGVQGGVQRRVWRGATYWLAASACGSGGDRELQTVTASHIPRGGGRFLLAAARPVMGIYFPQLCALVPASVHQHSAAKSMKGSVMMRSHARGCPALSEGLPGCSHTCPAQADMRFPNLPPHAPCQVTPPAPGAYSLGVIFSDSISNALIAKRQRKD